MDLQARKPGMSSMELSHKAQDSSIYKPEIGVKILEFEEIEIDSETSNNNRPNPRSGHRIVCDDRNVYSFGGYLEKRRRRILTGQVHLKQKLFRELWQLNMANGKWTLLPTKGRVPNELASHSAILLGKNLIIFGGTGVPFGSSSSNQMHICNLQTLQWSQVCARGKAPTPQYGQACVLDKSNFYVIGGTAGITYSLDIFKLDMNTWTWETLFVSRGSSGPNPRYRHEVCMKEGRIYIFGGGTGSRSFTLKNIPIFDVDTKKWMKASTLTTTNSFPSNRKCHGLVQVDDDVYIFGGYDREAICIDIWKLHLPSLKWSLLNVQMPLELYFHSCTVTEAGCMYMFGGVTRITNSTRTNRTFKIWLKIPSLKDMAWEVLTKANKMLCAHEKDAILASGLPREYAARLYQPPHQASMSTQSPRSEGTNEKLECKDNCIGPQAR